MKFFKPLFTYTICTALLAGPANLYAEPGSGPSEKLRTHEKSTFHGYNPGSFCSSGAENMMTQLEAANKAKFEQIQDYKKQIENLQKFDNLLHDVSTIKDNYLNSLAAASQTTASTDTAVKLDNAKSIIRESLTLDAISNLSKDNTDRSPADLTTKSLKESAPVKPTSTLSMLKNKLLSPSTKAANDDNYPANEADKLKQTVKNFKETANSLPANDQETLKKEVNKMIEDIPQEISPNTILNSLDKDSPLMTQVIMGNIQRDDLVTCLDTKEDSSKSNAACKKILNNPQDRKLFIDSISKESTALPDKLKSSQKVIAEVKERNKDELERNLLMYDQTSQRSSETAKKSIQEITSNLTKYSQGYTSLNMQIKESLRASQLTTDNLLNKSVGEKTKDIMLLKETDLNDIENFFYVKPTNDRLKALGIDINTPEGAAQAQMKQQTAIDNAKKDAAVFKKDCRFSDNVKSADESDKIKMCKGMVEKLIPQIKALKNSHYDQVADLNTKIQKLGGDSQFAAVENLKEYVAEKYMCSCEENKSKIKSNYEESLTMSSNSCSTQFMTLSKIEGLSNSTSAIAKALYAHEIKMPMDSQGCTFSPEKLKTFSDTCSNNESIASGYADICKSINNEYVAKVKVAEDRAKQDAKWEKYHEENYVEYNSKSPTGYSAVKKKSTARVIGEGVLPVLPRALPIWFGNYQMKQNINLLTDQALLQKQYLHNIDVYNTSPWMYGFNYFSYGNPFYTNSLSTLSTTSTTSTGFSF